MNYAELCRMYVAEHRENARFWTEDSAGTLYSKRYAKRATEIADLLDAAAGLYEGCSSVHFRDAQDAVALADAVAKGAK